ncbi:LppX_LprAFG lipoprotein [Microbacterium alcoholitolerans]|uniref:LppX_LprAFG lipoprotein n=1 Tax=unclassified Microbacterium TaxID=2609290 RepID=UPI003D170277
MSTFWRRAIATTTIALVAGMGLTACGAGGTENSTTEPKGSGSQSQTETVPETSGVMTADDFAQRINDAQFEAGSAHFVQTVEAAGQKMESTGDMVMDEDPSKVRMSMAMTGGMELRLVDGEMYLNMGELTGNKFFQPSSEDGNPIAEQLNSSLEQANLGKQLETFKAALKDFKSEEGAETIDGVETTKYTLTLDTETLFAEQGTEIPADAGIGDTLDYVIFVGSDDLPRRMVMDVAGSAVTMEFSKWGEAVTVEAPPADQITDEMPGM